MDKEKQIEEKQIEEMAEMVFVYIDGTCDISDGIKDCLRKGGYQEIKRLYNAGYRKVGENEVIVNKWDYNGLLQNKETLHKVYKAWDRSLEEQHQNTKELFCCLAWRQKHPLRSDIRKA